MKLYNITHVADIDGMSSAAALVHYFGMPVSHVFFYDFIGMSGQLMACIKRIAPRNSLFVITDVGTNPGALHGWEELLSYLKRNGNRVVWIDHHVWEPDWISRISRYCDIMLIREGKQYCATELVLRELCGAMDPKFGKRLANFAHLADFNIQTRNKRELLRQYKHTWAIYYMKRGANKASNSGLRRIVAQLAEGNYDSEIVDRAYKEYKKTADKQIALMLASAKVVMVNDLKVSIGFGQGLHATTATTAMEKRFRPKIAVYVNAQKDAPRMHLRSARSARGLDSSVIAFALGGGGHPYASAAALNPKKYSLSKQGDRERLVKEIEASIRSNYSRITREYRSR